MFIDQTLFIKCLYHIVSLILKLASGMWIKNSAQWCQVQISVMFPVSLGEFPGLEEEKKKAAEIM